MLTSVDSVHHGVDKQKASATIVVWKLAACHFLQLLFI
uniref:Uncharacterized protein n=1 Tax=Arundo donax TaxID=35708 RepID=A0A0A8ZM49_ARUDO